MTMRLSILVVAGAAALTTVSTHAADGVVPTPARSACRAMLTTADARSLAASTPNARAFQQNLKASLTTVIARSSGNSVSVRVLAQIPDHGTQEVGLYTVNLRSGRVTDDDQEPADDHETAAIRERLMAKHCH